ncbi:putative aspartate aminotransferase, cytoplasmic 2 [Protopterus annectens]|uniref:putative aspartate aminotransferase, cytoplasmic 2 n=1 Tax=Protopterus annectens TaxID=7888 RepID=UPI001CFB1035|nr:putative aspartate aminotransferase, cytoplasmic 2 [Protopterus annectens]
MAALSVFNDTPPAFPGEQLRIAADFAQDTDHNKVNLGSEEYCDEDNQQWVLPVVRKVQQHIANDPTLNHDHLPEAGLPEFTRSAVSMALGKDSIAILQNRAAGVQAIGGTGALFIGAKFLHRWYDNSSSSTAIYVASHAYEGCQEIFRNAGFENIHPYHYWDNEKASLATAEMLEDLQNAPRHSIVVLDIDSSTGTNPSTEVWEQIAIILKRRDMFPFFRLTAQGLVSGDLENDAKPLRHFVAEGFQLFCAQSFSRNFGLYDERVGNLTIVMKDNDTLLRVRSEVEKIVRVVWSSPPMMGSRIVTAVLNNPALYAEWRENLKVMVERIMLIRDKLKERLRLLSTPGSWEHITNQAGMYCFTGFSSARINYLIKKKHVYLMENGQINICKVNSKNLKYVTEAIHEAVTTDLQDCSQ